VGTSAPTVPGVRLLTWNVRGTHDLLHESVHTQRWLKRSADIVMFTETGYAGKPTPALSGFKCLACNERPRHSARDRHTGGVALYARHGLAGRITVVKDNPGLGHIWFRLDEGMRSIYVCAVYLPPQGSAYYKQEGGNLSAEIHRKAITEGVIRYKEKGEVLIMGDLNARTASIDERGDAHTWGGAHEGQVGAATRQRVGPRVSLDSGPPNAAGKWMVHLCKEEGLLILNGRTPGDEPGALTFHALGRDAESVADYAIASPALVFDGEGRPREGVSMVVHPLSRCPTRPDGGKYDHSPVVLTLGTTEGDDATPHAMHGTGINQPTRYRWPVEAGQAYGRALQDDMVRSKIRVACLASTVDEEQELLHEAVKQAAEVLHASGEVGRVRLGSSTRGGEGRPHNTWYGEGCRTAHRAARNAEKTHGPTATATLEARRAYRRVTRAARRAWEAEEFMALTRDLKRSPGKFWKKFNQGQGESGLRDIPGWTEYFKGLLGSKPDGPQLDPMFGPPNQVAIDQAAALNKAIEADEVAEALKKMACGTAPGVDGIPAEFYKYAWTSEPRDDGEEATVHVLLGPITHLLNRVLNEGYPQAWRVGATTPVPKPKGSLDVRDDYRGITVGGTLARLYSLVLLNRLDSYAEGHGYRARGQAGFRRMRGTPDNAFILNHVIERSRADGEAVYAGFIDFRKAYDSVDRDVLWKCLEGIGVHGKILHSMHGMYEGGGMCVRIDGQVGPAFTTHTGVRQGDPLSPLLFGLLIDTLEGHLDASLPDAGVGLGVGEHRQLLRLLLYADDLVLLASTRQELQDLLHGLQTFCRAKGLTVNVRKSEVVVFNSQTTEGNRTFTFDGQQLPIVDEFAYLGMPFHSRNGLGQAVDKSVAAGRRALFSLLRRLHEINVNNVHMRCHLFDTLVRPVVNYGCEVWGPGVLGGTAGASCMHTTIVAGAAAANDLQTQFLRKALNIRSQGQQAAVLALETGRRPLTADWLRQAARFWNKALARPDGDLLKEAMRESWQRAANSPLEPPKGWAAQLRLALHKEGHILEWSEDGGRIPIGAILDKSEETWLDQATSIAELPANIDELNAVRSLPEEHSRGYKMIVYQHWMRDKEQAPPAMDWSGINSSHLIGAMARFRMGVHGLRIETGRHCPGRLNRNNRICRLCERGDREDEAHVVFECPAYDEARQQAYALYTDLPDPAAGMDARMRAFMNPRPGLFIPGGYWNMLAKFLYSCQEIHSIRVSEIVEEQPAGPAGVVT
jgi:exonuclease III